MQTIEPGYGFRLLTDGEIIPAIAEYWCGMDQRWKKVECAAGHKTDHPNHKGVYRVQFEVGDGYELVKANEQLVVGLECKVGSRDWVSVQDHHIVQNWKTVRHCLNYRRDVLADSEQVVFRRKIAPPAAREHFIICQQFGFSSENHRYKAAQNPFTHHSECAALTEAQRLANTLGGKFVVFKAVAAYEKPVVPATKVEV